MFETIDVRPPTLQSLDPHSHVVLFNSWGPGTAITKGMLENIVTFHPRCHLDIQICGVWDTSVTLSQMRHNHCLTSLAVRLSHLHFEAFAELQVTAYSCPNLGKLSITIVDGTYRKEAGPLQWHDHTDRPLALHTLELDGFCPALVSGSALAVMTNVSMLKRLSVVNVPSVPDLDCGNLSSLRVALNGNRHHDSAEFHRMTAFLYLCRTLKELDLTGFTACVSPPLLEHLGKSLKVLRLHEYECQTGLQRRSVLSPEMILVLGVKCPYLDILGLDIAYQRQWVS